MKRWVAAGFCACLLIPGPAFSKVALHTIEGAPTRASPTMVGAFGSIHRSISALAASLAPSSAITAAPPLLAAMAAPAASLPDSVHLAALSARPTASLQAFTLGAAARSGSPAADLGHGYDWSVGALNEETVQTPALEGTPRREVDRLGRPTRRGHSPSWARIAAVSTALTLLPQAAFASGSGISNEAGLLGFAAILSGVYLVTRIANLWNRSNPRKTDRRYKLDRKIGQGGMATIFAAHDQDGNKVALKRLSNDSGRTGLTDQEAHALFVAELNNLGKVAGHPLTPSPRDRSLVRDQYGNKYLAMDFIEGHTLARWLETPRGRKILTPRQAADIAFPLMDVLERLHRQGIVYRDLKPSNIMMKDGKVDKLIDYGAARLYRPGLARDEIPLGTPGYAAPEQYGTAQSDARSDVYGLGALIHELVTGRVPPERPVDFRSPHSIDENIPEPFSEAIMKALQPDPRYRYQTVDEFRRALKMALPARVNVRV